MMTSFEKINERNPCFDVAMILRHQEEELKKQKESLIKKQKFLIEKEKRLEEWQENLEERKKNLDDREKEQKIIQQNLYNQKLVKMIIKKI